MATQIFDAKCGFFDSIGEDRLYFADDMNKPYKRIVADGVFATQSGTPATDLQVVAVSGMTIAVKKGEGLFAHKWFEVETDTEITVPSNPDTVERKDGVFVQVNENSNDRAGHIVYKSGMVDPVRRGGITEYRLAIVTVPANASEIRQANIADRRGTADCPWVTSLIKQVDTSTLYDQWYDAYQAFYQQEQNRMTEFMRHLTEELTVQTDIEELHNTFETTEETEEIAVGINVYDPRTDILQVYINGLYAVEGQRYTIPAFSRKIKLSPALTAGQRVDFVVLKAVASADNATALEMMEALTDTVTDHENRITENERVLSVITDGTGWRTIPLSKATTTASMTASVKQTWETIYIRGCVSGVTQGDLIGTLTEGYRPKMTHVYTAPTDSGEVVSVRVLPSGEIRILSGEISTDTTVYIATSYML